MKSCGDYFCRPICRIESGAILKKFSKLGSLDELEELWRELASKSRHFLDKEEVAKHKKEENPS
ncbi:hypothetical protein ACFLYY_01985 [Patescibacteria group bacterium]